MKSKLVEKKLEEAAKKLNCRPGDIWEDICAGYVNNIPSEKEIIEDIEYYVKDKK